MKWPHQEVERLRAWPEESGGSIGSQITHSSHDTNKTNLREEFQTDGGINGNVPSDTETDEGCENEDSIVSGRRCKAQTEHRRDQDCQIKGVLAA